MALTAIDPLKVNKLEDSAAGAAIAAVNNASPILHTFVDFTSDLLREVFKTIVGSTIEQLEAYADLVAKVSGSVADYEFRALGGDTDQAALTYINQIVLPAFAPTATALTAIPIATDPPIAFDPAKLADLDASFAGVSAFVIPANAAAGSATLVEETFDQALVKTPATGGPPTSLAMKAIDLQSFAVAKLKREVQASYDKVVTLLKLGMARIVVTDGHLLTSVSFHVDSTDTAELNSQQSQTDFSTQSSNWAASKATSGGISGGANGSGKLVSWIVAGSFGGNHSSSSSGSATQTTTKVNVLNEKKTASTNLGVDIAGSVRIAFRSDFFPAFDPASVPAPAAA
jgi:hypothetical protein